MSSTLPSHACAAGILRGIGSGSCHLDESGWVVLHPDLVPSDYRLAEPLMLNSWKQQSQQRTHSSPRTALINWCTGEIQNTYMEKRLSCWLETRTCNVLLVCMIWLTLRSWTLLERPLDVRPFHSFRAFNGTRRLNTEFTCSHPEPDQSTPHHPIPPFQDPC
jgi:hypothetical protein